jgi:2-oxoglutarate ferredoxin oxidoreductase subunit beta
VLVPELNAEGQLANLIGHLVHQEIIKLNQATGTPMPPRYKKQDPGNLGGGGQMKTPGREIAQRINGINRAAPLHGAFQQLPTWCPGCGYFGIHQGINDALQNLGLPLHQVVAVSGIGCAGRYPFFQQHLRLAHHPWPGPAGGDRHQDRQPRAYLLCVGGDGDGLGIGGGHLPHAARRDIDINYVLFDNSIYGLTKGQPSPSQPVGIKTKASPQGNAFKPIDGTLMALSYGAGFLARCFAGDPVGITQVHDPGHPASRGSACLHVYSTCLTFDKQLQNLGPTCKEWVHPLPEDHDPANRKAAMVHAMDDQFSMGIVYQET